MSATKPLHLHVPRNFSKKKRIMKGLPLSFLFSHNWRHVFFALKLQLLPKWLTRFQNFLIRTCECEWVMSNVKTFKKTWIYALAISENNIASLWVHIKFSDTNWRKLPFKYYGKTFLYKSMGNAIYNEIKKSQRNELQSKVVKVEIIEQKEFPFYILWILGSIPITTLICYFLCISCRRR